MRISDWISDVCSSDLRWVRSCRPIVGFARAGKSEKHGWPRAPCPAAKARYSGPLTRGGRIAIMERLIGLLGIVVLLAIAVLFSSNRRWIRPPIVVPAFLPQAGFAGLGIGTPGGRAVIQAMSNGVANLLGYAKAGTDFIFGPLASPEMVANSFAIAALPVIIFFASLISILYYLGIMQLVIKWVGGAIQKVKIGRAHV